jgi:integrase/recombinase XerD
VNQEKEAEMTTFGKSSGDVEYRKPFLRHDNSRGRSPTDIPEDVYTKWFLERTEQETRAGGAEDNRRALDQAVRKLAEQELPGGKHLERYLRRLYRRNCRANTIRSSGTKVRLFLTFLKTAGRRSLDEIARADLEAFVEHEQDRGLAPAAIKYGLVCVYAFLRFASEEGIVSSDLLLRKIKVRLPDVLPRAMDVDDVRRLLSVIEAPRDRAMILTLLRTGMRIGELLRTEVRDLYLEDRKILIFEGEKNWTGRVVYLSDDALAALRVWLKIRDPEKRFLFHSLRGSTLGYSSARLMFVKYLKAAGLRHKGYTLHCLRHTFATELLNAGMRIECLQQLLGHSNLEETRRYARLTDKTREEEYFRAMRLIEGENHDDQLDSELPAIFEEKEPLSPHGEELPE